MDKLRGIGNIPAEYVDDFIELDTSEEEMFTVGREGVQRIWTLLDRKVEFICFKDKTLAYVKSAMGCPALYPVPDVSFEGPAKAVLMDLDGTSVRSEAFWVWVIEQSIARLLHNPKFQLDSADEPFVSGYSVSEHLRYCINKYCPDKTVEEARQYYFQITYYEMSEIMAGRGRKGAFTPTPGLKEFLMELKSHGVKIGLVTSGLYEKAWPEVLSAFQTLEMGDPLKFYDAIITAGSAIRPGQCGTLGELSPKPHPWLYAETARVGLGIDVKQRHRVIGMEDSAAGVISIRLAGFASIGVAGGNIEKSGACSLLHAYCEDLSDALPLILGQ